MSYCKKYNMHPSVALCLACEECYPPGERVNGRMCGYEESNDTGRKRLTDEQKAKLKEAVSDFAYCAVIGLDPELHDDPYLSDLLQRKVIEPFIEPLINGEI